MKYNTPELLLVGAAQNLVLNGHPSLNVICRPDDPDSYLPELW